MKTRLFLALTAALVALGFAAWPSQAAWAALLSGGIAGLKAAAANGKAAPLRMVQVDLDYVYDPDAAQETHNLDALIARLREMKINTVFLQAFSDAAAAGVAKSVYFPNRFLPVRQDLFARVARALKKQAGVAVYGWMPVLSFDFGRQIDRVEAWNPKTGKIAPDPKAYQRISPFDAEGRKRIIGLYEDLARAAPIDGILFHDDATMSDFEDASPAAMATYQKAGFPASIAEIRAHPRLMARWIEFKTGLLTGFTEELAADMRKIRPHLKTARNIYARLLTEPKSEAWFAQSYPEFLKAYDYTAVEAMPDMENIPPAGQKKWLSKLVAVAASMHDGLRKTIFELQSVDWRVKTAARAIPAKQFDGQVILLADKGAMNFGYYPDDFVANVPNARALHRVLSLPTPAYQP
ncbi:MAG: poly-beta-1,6-N-acetyl-D-glucosamine N-deacetylase PgaB [Alphaproteobacteria bacterium]|nr:poly-beta-1,6-N-acetyl-D-glucosamine N-deacetylase PgaB [Alphaproteobacteria bacterium]